MCILILKRYKKRYKIKIENKLNFLFLCHSYRLWQKHSNYIFCYINIHLLLVNQLHTWLIKIYKQPIIDKLVNLSILFCPILSYQTLNSCSVLFCSVLPCLLCFVLSWYQTHPNNRTPLSNAEKVTTEEQLWWINNSFGFSKLK